MSGGRRRREEKRRVEKKKVEDGFVGVRSVVTRPSGFLFLINFVVEEVEEIGEK